MPKKLSDHSKDVRIQNIYNILKHHTSEEFAMTKAEIHHQLVKSGFDCSQKSVERALQEMSTTHKILSTETFPNRFFCTDDFHPDYQLNFSEYELKTISLALKSLHEMADPFQKSLCTRTETIFISKLPKDLAREFELLRSLTIVSPALRAEAGVENSEVYKKVIHALKGTWVITCLNRSPYKEKQSHEFIHRLSPLKLNLVGSEQYLIVHDNQDLKIKRLKICRLHNVEITQEKIDPLIWEKAKSINNQTIGSICASNKIIKYVIHCDQLMASLFKEKKLHPSQVVEEGENKYIITFETNESIEIIRYLAGWAKHIISVEPREVFDEIKEIWAIGAALCDRRKAA